MTRIVSTHGEAGNLVDLDAERRRRRPHRVTLSDAEVEAFSAAIRLVEPRSADYWWIYMLYLRACGEVAR